MKRLIGALSLLFLAGCVAQPIDPPLGTNNWKYGYIDKGGKLGVKIGDLEEVATRTLEASGLNLRHAGECGETPTPNRRVPPECPEGATWKTFHKPIDYVTIFLKDGRVSGIRWSFFFSTWDL